VSGGLPIKAVAAIKPSNWGDIAGGKGQHANCPEVHRPMAAMANTLAGPAALYSGRYSAKCAAVTGCAGATLSAKYVEAVRQCNMLAACGSAGS
jgi:hypothetical protein